MPEQDDGTYFFVAERQIEKHHQILKSWSILLDKLGYRTLDPEGRKYLVDPIPYPCPACAGTGQGTGTSECRYCLEQRRRGF